LEALVASQAALIGELREEVCQLRATVAELQGRLGANSGNSSRPPSSDGLGKAPVDPKKRSLRKASGRKQGGQEEHPGARLLPAAVSDEIVEHLPQCCGGCGGDLAGAEKLHGGQSRQVFDVPEQAALRVIEHVAALRRCACGHVTAGLFPDAVCAPVQYGPGVRALGVYLVVFQFLPYDRACQALSDMVGAQVSTGSLVNWVTGAADGLCDFDERLRGLLSAAPVVNFDETGARIAGRLNWVHSASTDTLTRYTSHTKRGCEAIDAAGILPAFTGVAVHDGWAPYRKYDCDHGLCNIHHLRELVGASEAGHTWPVAMSRLLLDTKDLVAQARGAGATQLDHGALTELAASFATIIKIGHQQHPATTAGKRTKAHNLLLRLERHQPDVLRFAHDFRVPFGNNQAEQDIRMAKLQQKISGCWRTPEGAQRFLTIRSYISTTLKHSLPALPALRQLTAGTPWLPHAALP